MSPSQGYQRTKVRTVKYILPLLAVAALVAGCSVGSDESAEQVSVEDETAVEEVIEISEARFDFTAPELETNRIVEGAELFAQRPLILTFVVPDCPVCVEEGPLLAASAENNSEITYVFIHSGAGEEEYVNFVQNTRLVGENVVHIRDDAAATWELFGVTQQPSTVLVDTEGVSTISIGALGEEGLASAAELVLTES